MAGKELRANIILGGQIDNSFYRLGNSLEALGTLIEPISRELIDFGKESTNTYVDYEDAMLDAQVALRTQYDTTSELGKAMEQLDRSAMQWAAASRFTTNDVAGAISNAAHAGWDLEQILNGVPEAMNISLAGGMDLAQGLEYLVDITNAAGLGFDELGELTDYWAYAANSSSTTIPEMGQAMQKMGATMQFVKGDMAGLTTMLAVLADNGTKGTEAGTLLRNSMIRLIAPTQKAAEAMDSLELTSEDLEDIYSDTEGLEEAVSLLKEAGFNAYDSNGDLKSFLTIWEELNKATSGMTEEKRNQILSAIFPTRTITGALAMLDAASKGWDGLYESISGNSFGYADYARDTMESGLGGSLRQVEAAWDVLQAKTGKELSEQVGPAADAITGMINAVNNLDDAHFSALVSGLETLAALGTGLTITGGALKMMGSMGVAGGIGLAAVAITAAAAAVNDLNEAAYNDKFGDITLDEGTIGSYITKLGESFATAQEDIDKYNKAVETAIADYTTASGTFKESLITSMLTGATLTDTDIQTLNGLGDQMRTALLAGIDGSYSANEEALFKLADFDSVDEGVSDDGMGGQILELLNIGYENAISEAETLSQQLRSAMTSAFDDGSLTNEEVGNIQSILNQMNELMAKQASKEMWMEEQKILRQAQTLGLEGLEQFSGQVEAFRDEQWEKRMQDYDEMRWDIDDLYAEHKGETIDGVTYDEAWYAKAQSWLDNQIAAGKQEHNAHFDDVLFNGYENAIQGSELGGAWNDLEELAGMYFAGEISGSGAHDAFRNLYGNNRYAGENDFELDGDNAGTQIGGFIASYIAALGGQKGVENRIAYLEDTGDKEGADRLRTLYAMEQIANDFAQTGVKEGTPGGYWDGNVVSSARNEFGATQANMGAFEAVTDEAIAAYSVEAARATADYFSGDNGRMDRFYAAIEEAIRSGDDFVIDNAWSGMDWLARSENRIMNEKLRQIYDFEKVLADDDSFLADENNSWRNDYAAWKLMYGGIDAEQYRIQVLPEVDQSQIEAQIGDIHVPVDIRPREDGEGLAALEEQGVEVSVDGDATELNATIDGADGQTLLEYVSGDAEDLEMTITDQDGRTLVEKVTGDASALAAIIGGYNNQTITVNIRGRKMFAAGGRATEPSIFGDAGPEWAIPEEHSQRTAELINLAREGSGFTWGELLSRNGGLNAGRTSGSTIVYSPTIYAQDASGVEDKLLEDKARLERMLRDREMRDDIEVYA